MEDAIIRSQLPDLPNIARSGVNLKNMVRKRLGEGMAGSGVFFGRTGKAFRPAKEPESGRLQIHWKSISISQALRHQKTRR